MVGDFNASHVELNTTCFNESCKSTLEPPSFHLKWPLLALILVIMCTACGNLLVCLAVCWERRLQNMTNYFLMSLAIADFLVSIIVMPFGMIVEIYGYFPLDAQFCAFWVTMDVLMCTASIWHMCTMSLDRYITLKYPMQYGRNKTKKMVAVKIIFVWIVSIMISSSISIYSLIDETTVFNDNVCTIAIKEFVIYGSIFAFYVPLCIMLLTYMLTIRILWQNQHMMVTVARSQFRLKSRNSTPTKTCHVTALLSPPSSVSRRESHTDVSSVARTPLTETITPKESSKPEDMNILDLKNTIPNVRDTDVCTDISENNDYVHRNSINLLHETKNENANTCVYNNKAHNCENRNQYNLITCYNNDLDISQTYLNIPLTTVQIQSPSSDDDDYDDDASSALLRLSTEKLSRSHSQSSADSRYRLRTNTDVSTKSHLTAHNSLKHPKTCEKYLQASVSCSNFTNGKSGDQDRSETLGLHGCGLNRDYKSLEWCHHFYEIQEEMDECLREAKNDRKYQNVNFKANNNNNNNINKLTSTSLKELTNQNSTETQDSGIASSVKQHVPKSNNQMAKNALESCDLMDENDTSSETGSELVSINLHPKSVYAYKLDVNWQNQALTEKEKSNGNVNALANKKSLFLNYQDGSTDSDKSFENDHRILQNSGSIKQFLHMWRKGNLSSSKTNTNERKASKVLGIIFAVFVILWSPFFIANILSVTCQPCQTYITGEMMSAYVWMGYIASLANPIIYTIFNTAFRRTFIKILSCHICTKGTNAFSRQHKPSNTASLYRDRRHTLTAFMHGNIEKFPSDIPSNLSIGK